MAQEHPPAVQVVVFKIPTTRHTKLGPQLLLTQLLLSKILLSPTRSAAGLATNFLFIRFLLAEFLFTGFLCATGLVISVTRRLGSRFCAGPAVGLSA